jgi:hypothetical protein
MDRIYFSIRMSPAMDEPCKKEAAGLGTLRLLCVLSEASRRLSLKEPRDQSHVDRRCLRNKHARECQV